VLTRRPRPLDGRLLDHCGLRLILSGAMGVGESGNLELAAPGDLVFIDLSQPVRLEYAGKEPTAELTLWVPRGHQAIGSRAPGSLHGRLLRAGDPAAAVVGAALRALHAELDRLAPPDLDQLVGGIFGLGMTRMLASADAAAPPPSGLESFATICRYIETNLAASDLGVARLARTFGKSCWQRGSTIVGSVRLPFRAAFAASPHSIGPSARPMASPRATRANTARGHLPRRRSLRPRSARSPPPCFASCHEERRQRCLNTTDARQDRSGRLARALLCRRRGPQRYCEHRPSIHCGTGGFRDSRSALKVNINGQRRVNLRRYCRSIICDELAGFIHVVIN
jgi:hypothetical protein